MFIGFYTSRVVLRALGAEDFGTYNVVGGVVVMITIINTAMTPAISKPTNLLLLNNEQTCDERV